MAVLGLAAEMPRHRGFASCIGSDPTRLSAWRAARPAGRAQRSARGDHGVHHQARNV